MLTIKYTEIIIVITIIILTIIYIIIKVSENTVQSKSSKDEEEEDTSQPGIQLSPMYTGEKWSLEEHDGETIELIFDFNEEQTPFATVLSSQQDIDGYPVHLVFGVYNDQADLGLNQTTMQYWMSGNIQGPYSIISGNINMIESGFSMTFENAVNGLTYTLTRLE